MLMDNSISINTSTKIKALSNNMSMVSSEFDWLFQNSYGIQFNDDGYLEICGLYDCDNYTYWKDSPYHDMCEPEEMLSFGAAISLLLESHYMVLLYISTKRLKVTKNREYVHEVLITDKSDICYDVYDFWPPSFIWEKRTLLKQDLESAIVDKNVPIKIIGIKRKKISKTFYAVHSVSEYAASLLNKNHYLNIKHLKPVFGMQIYQAFANSSNALLDVDKSVSNFQTLIDHSYLWLNYCVSHNIDADFKILHSHMKLCKQLRNLCIKARLTNTLPNLDYLICSINELEQYEKIFLNKII